jgi:hypothetical protein
VLCDIADQKCDKAVIESVEMSKFRRRDSEVSDASARPPDVDHRPLDVSADQSFNRRAIVSRQFEFRAVVEYNGIFSLVLWPKFLDSLGIH